MKLPVVSGLQVIKILSKIGFERLDQHGSHVILQRKNADGKVTKTVVPLHSELATGTLLSIIKQTGLSRDEFIELYYK